MKRVILVIALLVLSFPVSSAAQMVFNAEAGMSVQAAIDGIAQCAGLKSNLNYGANIEKLTLSENVSVPDCNTTSGSIAGLNKVLPPQFEFAVDREGVVQIRPAKMLGATEGRTGTHSPTPAPTTALMKRGTISGGLALNPNGGFVPTELLYAPRPYRIGAPPLSSYGGGIGSSYYGHGIYAYDLEWLKLDPFLREFFSNERNRQTYGLLKIDGPDRQHRNVRVLVNDADKGVASKYDNASNGAILVQVRDTGCDPFDAAVCQVRTHKVQFTKEEKENIRRVTRFSVIEPFEVTGARNMLRLRVDNDMFTNAEIIDSLQQQSLPDSQEGGPVPSKKRR